MTGSDSRVSETALLQATAPVVKNSPTSLFLTSPPGHRGAQENLDQHQLPQITVQGASRTRLLPRPKATALLFERKSVFLTAFPLLPRLRRLRGIFTLRGHERAPHEGSVRLAVSSSDLLVTTASDGPHCRRSSMGHWSHFQH